MLIPLTAQTGSGALHPMTLCYDQLPVPSQAGYSLTHPDYNDRQYLPA
jgi:hypothetical protein